MTYSIKEQIKVQIKKLSSSFICSICLFTRLGPCGLWCLAGTLLYFTFVIDSRNIYIICLVFLYLHNTLHLKNAVEEGYGCKVGASLKRKTKSEYFIKKRYLSLWINKIIFYHIKLAFPLKEKICSNSFDTGTQEITFFQDTPSEYQTGIFFSVRCKIIVKE